MSEPSPSTPDFEAEKKELVYSARRSGLERVPFPTESAGAERRREPLPSGGVRYFYGDFYVDIAMDGRIQVREGDWISKYTLAIDGTTVATGKFLRVLGDTAVPLADVDRIYRGETLIHLETSSRLLARLNQEPRSQQQRLQDMFGSKDDSSIGGLLGSFQREALEEDLRRRKFPAAWLGKGVFDLAATAVRKYSLRLLPDLRRGLSEFEKSEVFSTDAIGTVAVLLYELATGEGKQKRSFGEEHELTQVLMRSAPAAEALRAFCMHNKGAQVAADLRPLGWTGYAFSPDDTTGWAEAMRKHVGPLGKLLGGDPTDLFFGGMSFKVLLRDENDVELRFLDAKSRRSLILHFPRDVPRSLGEETPLGTTTQEYVFLAPIPWSCILDMDVPASQR